MHIFPVNILKATLSAHKLTPHLFSYRITMSQLTAVCLVRSVLAICIEVAPLLTQNALRVSWAEELIGSTRCGCRLGGRRWGWCGQGSVWRHTAVEWNVVDSHVAHVPTSSFCFKDNLGRMVTIMRISQLQCLYPTYSCWPVRQKFGINRREKSRARSRSYWGE